MENQLHSDFTSTGGGGAYLGHLWEEADGERQGQGEGGEAHQAVDGQDESRPSLQERKPGGARGRKNRHHLKRIYGGEDGSGAFSFRDKHKPTNLQSSFLFMKSFTTTTIQNNSCLRLDLCLRSHSFRILRGIDCTGT